MKLKRLPQVLNPQTVVTWTNSQPNSYGINHLLRLNYWHRCSINPYLLVNISRFLELQRLRQYTNMVTLKRFQIIVQKVY